MSAYLGSTPVNVLDVLFRNKKAVALYRGSTQVWSGWSPLDLFTGGKQGVWYDPSDKSTLFQDVAGIIPVTTDGDPVGLMLDKSQGLGVNLWSDINVTIGNSSGTLGVYKDLRMTNTTSSGPAYPRFSFNVGLVVGKRYYVKGVLKGNLSKLSVIRLSTGGNTSALSFNALTGAFIGCVVAESTVFQVATNLSTGEYLEISSIEIREAKGNHATQTLSASRPTYRTDGVLHWLDFDAVDDSLVIPINLNSKTFTLGLGYLQSSIDGAFVLMNSLSNSNYAFSGTAGNTSSVIVSTSNTLNFTKFDGVVKLLTNRGEMYTELKNSNVFSGSCTFSNTWSNSYGYSSFEAKSLRGFNKTVGYLLVEDLTDTTNMDKYLAKQVGVTL